MESFLYFVLGLVVGIFYAAQQFAKLIKNTAEGNVQISKDAKKATVPRLVTEVHGDTIYLFDKEKDSFICQAKTIEELAVLAKQYKNIAGAVVIHNEKVYAFVDGKSQEV